MQVETIPAENNHLVFQPGMDIFIVNFRTIFNKIRITIIRLWLRNPNVWFVGNVESFEKNFQSWGSIFSSGAISNKTTAYGDGIKQTVVGQIVVATITTKDWQVISIEVLKYLCQWTNRYDGFISAHINIFRVK